MRIFVIEPNTFTGDDLPVGEMYEVKPCEDGTERQNRAWHALLQEYFVSGCHSYDAKNFLHFRELIKLYLGAGVEVYYNLVDDYGKILNEPVKRYRVKSWSRYTKRERKESIDRLIAEMIQAGVDSKKFNEILSGLHEVRLLG
jgi:hypothetical protein